LVAGAKMTWDSFADDRVVTEGVSNAVGATIRILSLRCLEILDAV